MKHERRSISVVISAYTENRWYDLVRAVASVRRQNYPARETIVVVDHNPALLERARRALPDVCVVENTEERGLSGARNSGLAVATGEIVAFLDDDAVATPGWLEGLERVYSDPQVLGAGGAIEPMWDERRPAWFPHEFDWVVGCTYRGLPETQTAMRNMIGANMSFRREVFETVGGFRTGIGRVGTKPMGGEETELCIRAAQEVPGGVFLYAPSARVHHRVPEARAKWSYFVSRCYAEGQSKAHISQIVGAGDGLASERSHALKALPKAVARGIGAALLGGDLAGFARAAAVVAGLAVTTFGYATGILAQTLFMTRVVAKGRPAR